MEEREIVRKKGEGQSEEKAEEARETEEESSRPGLTVGRGRRRCRLVTMGR